MTNSADTNIEILIVEDEVKIADILVAFLQQEGFKTTVIHDGLHAVDAIKVKQPHFVILDLMLPNKDGLTICKEVRAFSNVPILMLTARVDEIDRLLGLNFGADDYVCKPFLPKEVVARVKTILRRTTNQITPIISNDPALLTYKNITLNSERFQCCLTDNGTNIDIELTPVEFRMLHALISRPGVVFSRDKLMSISYPDDRIVSTRTIDSHIKNLRSKLTTALPKQELLHSIYGVGYKVD